MLSNTATPKYYAIFRDKVLSGEIPVCYEISQEMLRIDALIADPRFYYDDEAVEGWIRYCEAEMVLTDGSDVVMLDSFKLWGEQLYGWYYFVELTVYEPRPDHHGGHFVRRTIKRRLVKKQFIVLGRGGAKSMYASFVQSYELNVNTTTTHQVAVAPTMKQAEEVLSPIKTAINRARGPLFKFLTEGVLRNTRGSQATRAKLASTKLGIQNFLTSSILEIRPMTIDKLQGLRAAVATVDEWLSGDIKEDVIGALEQGSAKGDIDYIIIAISSEGTVRNGSGDTIKMELASILRGEYVNPHISIFHYKLDNVKEVAVPPMWVKAQPNIGITVSYEAYHLDVERAEQAPASRNDILAKRFGLPMEGYTYFFTYEETLPHRKQDFWDLPCALGADLSRGDDFCAFTFMFPLSGGRFGVKSRAYITSVTAAKLPSARRIKYDEFLKEGSLHVLEGTVLDIDEVYDDLTRFIDDQKYDVRAMGYDPYNSHRFVERYVQENGPYGVEKVIQGSRTESVPLGDLKHLGSERALIFDQSIMTFSLGNAVTIEDQNGNRKLAKPRADQKVDPVSALVDAYVAWSRQKDSFE